MKKMKSKQRKKYRKKYVPDQIVIKRSVIPPQELKTTEIINEFNNPNNENWDDTIFLEYENELERRHPFEYIYNVISDLQMENDNLKSQINKLSKHHHSEGKILYEE